MQWFCDKCSKVDTGERQCDRGRANRHTCLVTTDNEKDEQKVAVSLGEAAELRKLTDNERLKQDTRRLTLKDIEAAIRNIVNNEGVSSDIREKFEKENYELYRIKVASSNNWYDNNGTDGTAVRSDTRGVGRVVGVNMDHTGFNEFTVQFPKDKRKQKGTKQCYSTDEIL